MTVVLAVPKPSAMSQYLAFTRVMKKVGIQRRYDRQPHISDAPEIASSASRSAKGLSRRCRASRLMSDFVKLSGRADRPLDKKAELSATIQGVNCHVSLLSGHRIINALETRCALILPRLPIYSSFATNKGC